MSPYDMGMKAYWNNQALFNNPFPKGSKSFLEWADGWGHEYKWNFGL